MLDLNQVLSSEQLPTPPAVAMKVLQVTRKPVPDVPELVSIIRGDPALVVKVLRVVNSSLFALRHKVAAIEQAVSLLGAPTVATLALGFALVSETLAKSPKVRHEQERYWKSALVQAVACHSLAKTSQYAIPSECFVMGLLKDIGQLALLHTAPKPYLALLKRAARASAPLISVEEQLLGFDHLELTCALFERWQFPHDWCCALRRCRGLLGLPSNDRSEVTCTGVEHLRSSLSEAPETPEVLELATALATSDGIAACVGSPSEPELHLRMAKLARSGYQLGGRSLARFVDQTIEGAREQASLYSLAIGELSDYDTILSRANAQLVNRALAAARSAAAPKRGAQPAGDDDSDSSPPPSSRPSGAKSARSEFVDQITKTYTRAFFFEIIQREYLRCALERGTVGMLCIALDQGEKLRAMDHVLEAVSRLLKEAVGESDAIARTDDTEFAVMLLGPDEEHLKSIAERVRDAVADAAIDTDERRLDVTVSVGAALAAPHQKNDQYHPLVITASDALATARRLGGNRVCVLS